MTLKVCDQVKSKFGELRGVPLEAASVGMIRLFTNIGQTLSNKFIVVVKFLKLVSVVQLNIISVYVPFMIPKKKNFKTL